MFVFSMSKIISVSLPKELADSLDAAVQVHALAGRSVCMRDALAHYLPTLTQRITGTFLVALIQQASRQQLHDIIHDFEDAIISHNHQHKNDACIDIVLLSADSAVLNAFVGACKEKGFFIQTLSA